jgi:lipopolysaccharide export system permease protein
MLVIWLAMVVAPWSARQIDKLLGDQHGQAAELAGVVAGRFNEYSQGDLVFYVESINDDERRMNNLFVQHRRAGEMALINAESGYHKTDAESGDRFLVLEQGYRYQGMPGAADYRISQFDVYALRIMEATPVPVKRPWKGLPNRVLLASDNIRDKTELQVRLSPVLALLVVAMLAMPLSRTTPRQGPFGRLVLAFLVYTIYLSLQGASEKWMAVGITPEWLGMWWVHLIMAGFALFLFVPDSVIYRRWRRRLMSKA